MRNSISFEATTWPTTGNTTRSQAASAGQMAFHDRLPAMTVADINHQIEQIQTSLNQLESLPVDQISDPTRQNEWYRLRSHARERLLNS